ncbi:MAG: phage GP46 family protein [Reyranella sp.]|uniref:phage GP46 family protein n=1 Tax=Reyranella sp. TaxID=1929291 RepID=UPI0027314043|nr:phage GP46 family protein [Reyranella sp.]MDP1960871.1 phage GP46 family protein [Reyranella sp.]MDP2375303.1 phage GP46 family protein [Reyranella sp.]
MSDLALFWDATLGAADLAIEDGQLVVDAGLRSAIVISLFSDRRADEADPLPSGGVDRRGWWGDMAPSVAGDQIGSRLWLLSREKRTPILLTRIREYCQEALAWLVADGLAAAVTVEAAFSGATAVAIGVSIARPDGPARQRYDFVWETL